MGQAGPLVREEAQLFVVVVDSSWRNLWYSIRYRSDSKRFYRLTTLSEKKNLLIHCPAF